MIEIFEDAENYLVRIRADIRDRVKKISGRQWDGDRKLWVFPKTSYVFESLAKEFSADATRFDIRTSTTHEGIEKNVKGTRTNDVKVSDEEIESATPIKSAATSVLAGIEIKLGQLQTTIEDLSLAYKSSLVDLQFLREMEEARLVESEADEDSSAEEYEEESSRESLDLNSPTDVLLFESALIEFCVRCTRNEPKFEKLVNDVRPLHSAYQFVLRAHEQILRQLREVAEDEAKLSFPELVSKIQQEKPIFGDPKEISRILSTLRTLNTVRNRMAHDVESISAAELAALAMLYLLNLALIWRPVMRDWVVSE